MMFLQYFLWGAWWVTLGSYMAAAGFSDIIGRTYATQGWGAIIALLFVGMIADRYFSAQKVMGGSTPHRSRTAASPVHNHGFQA